MPKVTGILETCLYADDLARTAQFYRNVFGFPTLVEDARLIAFAVSRQDVLILFHRGASLAGAHTPFGPVPPHDGSGPVHFAFSIEFEDLETWRTQLAAHGIAVESETRWPLGGISLYFRDPDGHLVELATPGVWDFSPLLDQAMANEG
jgi:catechol 2,3-dioxygenase-like lactoylglutathione lyase family enzyme